MVVVFSLPQFIEGKAPLVLRFDRFQGVKLRILRVRRVVVGGGLVGLLARVFEHYGLAGHNLHGARLEPLVRYV